MGVVTIIAVDAPPTEVGDEEAPPDAPEGLEPVVDAEMLFGGDLVDDAGLLPPPLNDAAGAPLDASGAADATTAEASAVDSGVAEDARADAAGADAGLPPCSGTRVLDLCWYLGAVDASCDQVCSGKGGNDTRAVALVGTAAQGGELSHCTQVLHSLGYAGTVTPGSRDQFGVGCHIWDSDGWWIETVPAFSTAAKTPYARIACACLR